MVHSSEPNAAIDTPIENKIFIYSVKLRTEEANTDIPMSCVL